MDEEEKKEEIPEIDAKKNLIHKERKEVDIIVGIPYSQWRFIKTVLFIGLILIIIGFGFLVYLIWWFHSTNFLSVVLSFMRHSIGA